MQEIERKFLVKKLPDLEDISKIQYERHFLEISSDREVRIQKKWERYEKETKTKLSDIEYKKEKKEISPEVFDTLKEKSIGTILRCSYELSKNPETSLKVYQWLHHWLIRIEVEFISRQEALDFKAPDWYGKEITGTPLANDSKLVKLPDKDFQNYLTL